MTGFDIIQSALRRLNIVNVGDPIEDEDASTAFEALNDLVDSWSIDRLKIFTVASATYPLTAGQASYTIGKDPTGTATADLDVARPARIENANLLIQGLAYPLYLANDDEWARRGLRDYSALPGMLYNDGGHPLSTLSLYPGPSEGWTLELFSWQALTQFADLSTDYALPPGYARALKFALAVELAPDYDREPSAALLRQAVEAKAAIENHNIEDLTQQCDPALIGSHTSRQQYGWIGNYR
jgi:hypothetical protein